jgi:general secretion pathway protein E
VAYAPDASELALLGSAATVLYRPAGCAACAHSGYRRRTGIYELLRVNDDLRRLIHDRVAEQSLREYALQHGMQGMRQDGVRLVLSGVTSLEELLRVTRT